MCDECFVLYFKLTGGTEGGSNPPAYSRAREKKMKNKIGNLISKKMIYSADKKSIICNILEKRLHNKSEGIIVNLFENSLKFFINNKIDSLSILNKEESKEFTYLLEKALQKIIIPDLYLRKFTMKKKRSHIFCSKTSEHRK